jgi:hypothetical protein
MVVGALAHSLVGVIGGVGRIGPPIASSPSYHCTACPIMRTPHSSCVPRHPALLVWRQATKRVAVVSPHTVGSLLTSQLMLLWHAVGFTSCKLRAGMNEAPCHRSAWVVVLRTASIALATILYCSPGCASQ